MAATPASGLVVGQFENKKETVLTACCPRIANRGPSPLPRYAFLTVFGEDEPRLLSAAYLRLDGKLAAQPVHRPAGFAQAFRQAKHGDEQTVVEFGSRLVLVELVEGKESAVPYRLELLRAVPRIQAMI